ncbi:MAG: hypothetical protein K2W82_06115 [Candidatus Obscuribacterales bacterium]|nr:hypothetical protein [Candidatus Obscuribacterales bacterium]
MSDNSLNFNLFSGLVVTDEILNVLLRQFNAKFPTEKDCLEELYRRAKVENVFCCRYCKNKKIEKKYGDRVGKCPRCYQRTWFTGGTFFNRIRTARPWLLAIWLMERGVVISSSRFHKFAGIAQSSALNIFKKIMMVVQNHMQEVGETLPSSFFELVFFKRSRETKAREHPLSEQEEMEKQLAVPAVSGDANCEKDIYNSLEAKEKESLGIEFDRCEKEVYDILSADPIHIDTLCQKAKLPVNKISAALTMLELRGVAVRLAGDRYTRYTVSTELKGSELETSKIKLKLFSQPSFAASAGIKELVDAAISFIRNKFHGVSRKYLQNYLAAYWLELAKPKWKRNLLLKWCWHFEPICYKQILAYVSPVEVKLPPNASSAGFSKSGVQSF